MDHMRWLVMQSLKYKKWVLAVIWGEFEEYQVTELMSDHVDKIVQYADYLNTGKRGSAIDQKCMAMLEQVRAKYEGREA